MSVCLFPIYHYCLPPWQQPMISCTYITVPSVRSPLCVPSHTQWYHNPSESPHAQSVGFVPLATSLSFHTLKIALITIVLKIVSDWVLHPYPIHMNLLWQGFIRYNVLIYLDMEAYWLHSSGRAPTCKILSLNMEYLFKSSRAFS